MACNEAVQNDTIIAQLKKRKSYLRSSEVMELFGGLSRQTLCGWARDGILNAIRIGKDNMFDPADLVRFLEARKVS
jgi:Helix-turn-helix domain